MSTPRFRGGISLWKRASAYGGFTRCCSPLQAPCGAVPVQSSGKSVDRNMLRPDWRLDSRPVSKAANACPGRMRRRWRCRRTAAHTYGHSLSLHPLLCWPLTRHKQPAPTCRVLSRCKPRSAMSSVLASGQPTTRVLLQACTHRLSTTCMLTNIAQTTRAQVCKRCIWPTPCCGRSTWC